MSIFDFIIDLVVHTKVLKRPPLLIGIVLVGFGVIVLLTEGLSSSASAIVIWSGVASLIIGGAMVAVELFRWSVQDHLK